MWVSLYTSSYDDDDGYPKVVGKADLKLKTNLILLVRIKVFSLTFVVRVSNGKTFTLHNTLFRDIMKIACILSQRFTALV